MNALRPLALAAFNLLHLVRGINHSERRLDLVACIGNEPLLFAVALDHRSNHGARGDRYNCQHRQPANAADCHTRAQKRIETCKLARTVHEHIGGLFALSCGRIAVVTRKPRGQALGIQPHGNTGGTLGAHRGNAGGIDIDHPPFDKRHRKVARVEGGLRRHAFKMSHASARSIAVRKHAGARVPAIAGIGPGLVFPIEAAPACQDIVQASIGHLADMRVVDDIDAGNDEREHHGHSAHGNEDELATQAAAQCVSSICPPRTTRGGTRRLRHALTPRAHAHACSLSSTTSSEYP